LPDDDAHARARGLGHDDPRPAPVRPGCTRWRGGSVEGAQRERHRDREGILLLALDEDVRGRQGHVLGENSGKKDHNFQINGKKTSVLKPGKSAKLTVTFGKAGSYSYSSTVADDAKKGMKGTFTAKDVSAGKKVYGSTGCGACHTFKAAGTTGKVGPNLDKSKTSRSTIESVITKGKGTMPSYKGQLTSKQIDDVSDFVFYSRTG
jgi:cytochrome c5